MENPKNKGSFEWYSLEKDTFVFFEKRMNGANWTAFSKEENIFQIDFDILKQKMHSKGILEEMLQKVFQPKRLEKFVLSLNEYYGIFIYDMDEYLEFLM